MAQVQITFDTVEKTLAVSVDGSPIADVHEAYLSKSYYDDDGGYACSITTVAEDKDNKTRTITRVVAKDSRDAAHPSAAPCPELPDFVYVDAPKAEAGEDEGLVKAVAALLGGLVA